MQSNSKAQDPVPTSVCFVERRRADTPSIESVFRRIAAAMDTLGIRSRFDKLPFGNGLLGMIGNLWSFRPAPANIYHITGHVHYIALVLPRDRTVLTIHDLNILRMRTGLRRIVLKKLLFDWPLSRTRYVTAISEATRDALVDQIGCDDKKVRVIGNPVSGMHLRHPADFNYECPTILQVGTAPHKNLETVARALFGFGGKLRIIGPLRVDQEALLKVNNIRFENVTGLSENEMLNEYKNTDIVVFCSVAEGFGMPIIEAQAIGRPVITSRLRPMSDVAGRGALLVDPNDSDEIRAGIDRLISSSELRAKLVERGFENVTKFSSENIGRQYSELYREIFDSLNQE
jgi:glycosyltransferase involved in cell wall biosynthesis